jgi:CRISP-associated protein Cas1
MQQILNTLYVTTPNAYVHLDNDTVRIEVERETRLRVPLHHLGAVVCFGNVLLSPAIMARCAEEGIGLVLLDMNGRFRARVEGPVSGNILLRQAQHRKAAGGAGALELARAIVAGKIRNTRAVAMRGARDAINAADEAALSAVSVHLDASLRQAADVADLDALRGVEGEAARNYFSALSCLVKADVRASFGFSGRTRRPPRDRMNAMLSFLYSMLMNDCRSAVEAVGLDPQLGFLHAVRPGRAALALDLMEEFRAYIADRLALTLVNRAQIRAEDFDVERSLPLIRSASKRRSPMPCWTQRCRLDCCLSRRLASSRGTSAVIVKLTFRLSRVDPCLLSLRTTCRPRLPPAGGGFDVSRKCVRAWDSGSKSRYSSAT